MRQRHRRPEAEESAEAVPGAAPEAEEPPTSVAEEPDEAELLASLDELLLTGACAADETKRQDSSEP